MALPASGAISLSELATEYGETAPYSLSTFLGKPGAPTAVPYSITDWYGLSDHTIEMLDSSASTSNLFPTDAYAGFKFYGSGNLYRCNNSSTLTYSDYSSNGWNTEVVTGSDYELKAVIVSGVASGDSKNVWLNLGTNREFYNGVTAIATINGTLDITIRRVGEASTEVTNRFIMNTTVDS